MGGKGSGRKRKGEQVGYDPTNPDTWPKSWTKTEERVLYVLEILGGHKMKSAPKHEWVDKMCGKSGRYHDVRLDRDMLETIADIQAMYKMGGFSRMPLPVALKIANKYSGTRKLFDVEDIDNPSPTSRPWKPSDIICMALEVFRMYLMGMDPMFNRIVRRTLAMDGNTIGLEKIAIAIDEIARYEGILDIEDYDYDFDSVDDEREYLE